MSILGTGSEIPLETRTPQREASCKPPPGTRDAAGLPVWHVATPVLPTAPWLLAGLAWGQGPHPCSTAALGIGSDSQILGGFGDTSPLFTSFSAPAARDSLLGAG